MGKTTTRWLIFGLLQAGWLAAVLGAAAGRPWLGPAVVAVLVVLHWIWIPGLDRWREAELMIVLGISGTAIDSLQSGLGLIRFEAAPAAWLCPLWISSLWVHFATTRSSLLAMLRGRPVLAALLGAVAGPLAYGAGVRLEAATFHPEPVWSLMSLAVVWGLILPAATAFTWRRCELEGEKA